MAAVSQGDPFLPGHAHYFWLCGVLCSEFDPKIPFEECIGRFHTDLIDFACCKWEKQCHCTGISLLLRNYTCKGYYEAFQWLCVVCDPKFECELPVGVEKQSLWYYLNRFLFSLFFWLISKTSLVHFGKR